ncbi:hypothetical protein DFQ26_004006 [Actinomortierella ambigua]|nr:hypothetical protein DFQ26_004006 [Actinomortierella ambigua]
MTFTRDCTAIAVPRRTRFYALFLVGTIFFAYHYVLLDSDLPDGSKDAQPQPTTSSDEDWKTRAQALELQVRELQAKLKLGAHENAFVEKSQPYRISLEDDLPGIEGSGDLDGILNAPKTTKTSARDSRTYRNTPGTRQHGGVHNEVLYMQSDRQLNIPTWDKSRPLPAWWEETQRLIKELEARPNMGPLPDKYILVDVCIWLGYNNVRYILENGALFAELAGRTLVFPEYVYMRACDESDLCRLYGTLEDLAYAPDNKFPRWTVPTNEIWDLPEIRKRHNIITTSEFVKIQLVKHGIVVEDPKEWIESRGGELGAAQPLNIGMAFLDVNSSLTMESRDFLDEWYPYNSNQMSFDDIDPLPNHGALPSLAEASKDNPVPPHPMAPIWSFKYGPDMSVNWTTENLQAIRWAEDYSSTFVNPNGGGIIPVGFKQMYASIKSDYVHWIEGIHRFGWPPCQFTSEEGRDRFIEIVVKDLKVHPDIVAAREAMFAKLQQWVGGEGRTYQAVHLRQGDMIALGYFPKIDPDEFARVVAYTLWRHRMRVSNKDDPVSQLNRDGLHSDRRPDECDSDVRVMKQGEIVWSLDGTKREASEGEERPVTWDEMMACMDKTFYFATDSTDPAMVQAMRKYGSFQIEDLIDAEFFEKHMKIAAFGDLKGIVEQWMMANARYFLGSFMSSVSGGVLNNRLLLGKSPQSSSFLSFHSKWTQLVDDIYYQNKLPSLSESERTEWIAEYNRRKSDRANLPRRGFQDWQGDALY